MKKLSKGRKPSSETRFPVWQADNVVFPFASLPCAKRVCTSKWRLPAKHFQQSVYCESPERAAALSHASGNVPQRVRVHLIVFNLITTPTFNFLLLLELLLVFGTVFGWWYGFIVDFDIWRGVSNFPDFCAWFVLVFGDCLWMSFVDCCNLILLSG